MPCGMGALVGPVILSQGPISFLEGGVVEGNILSGSEMEWMQPGWGGGGWVLQVTLQCHPDLPHCFFSHFFKLLILLSKVRFIYMTPERLMSSSFL